MKRRLAIFLVAALVSVFGAAACGGEEEAGDEGGGGEGGAGGDTTVGDTTLQGGGNTVGDTTMQDGTTAEQPITDVETLLAEPNKQSLVGRPVRLTGVSVPAVVGDITFLVGPNEDQAVPAVLEDELAGEQPDTAVNINPGQTIALTGEVREFPSVEEAQRVFGLSGAEAAELQNQGIYLLAEEVEIMAE